MRKVVMVALALSCVPATLFGQALHPDSLFPRLIGHWVLRGTIARQQTIHDVTFEWLLGREYVQMHEVSRERAPTGTAAYEAVVLFGRDPKTGGYACMWMDNTAAAAFPPDSTFTFSPVAVASTVRVHCLTRLNREDAPRRHETGAQSHSEHDPYRQAERDRHRLRYGATTIGRTRELEHGPRGDRKTDHGPQPDLDQRAFQDRHEQRTARSA